MTARLLALTAALACAVTPALAAELPDAAARRFDEYFEHVRQAFVAAALRTAGPDASLQDGRTTAGPASGDGIVDAPSSLMHHWRGRVFIEGASLDHVLESSRDYESYPEVFQPIQRARIVSNEGGTVRIAFRMRASGGGLSATLDVLTRAEYVRLDAGHAYVVSRSESIREVRDAGKPTERQLPEGRDSGYLWRASTFTRFAAVDGGVVMEMETLGLSRPFPRGLGWIIEPIARRIGRRSVEQSLREFRQAVLRRGKLTP